MTLVDHHTDFVERHEKMLLFNTINESEFCTNVLFCFRCEEWLTPPIFTEDLGVHFCGRCRANENEDEDENENEEPAAAVNRNKKLEALLSKYFFPCKHYKKGCGVVCKFGSILQHEEECNVVTNAWKDLHCCVCEFKTPGCQDLIGHYKDVHAVATIQATGQGVEFTAVQLNTTTGLVFVEIESNTLVFRRTTKSANSADIQICAILGILPQFQIDLNCYYCKHLKLIPIDSNMNQLRFQGTIVSVCGHELLSFKFSEAFCANLSLGCLSAPHADGVACTYGCAKCCEQSFMAREHYEHILDKHVTTNGTVLKRDLDGQTGCQYIKVDANIFRLENNSLAKLYWFGGNWKYSVYVLFEGALTEEYLLELSEIHKLPENWDMLYICRFLEENE